MADDLSRGFLPGRPGRMTYPERKKGFQRLTEEQRRAVSAAGGRAAHRSGRGRTWTREQAAEAGRKGALARRAREQERRAAEEREGPKQADG